MLILTRRIGETFMIGDTVTVTVLDVKGNQIQLGVNAPKTIPVHREEVYQRIQIEKAQKMPVEEGIPRPVNSEEIHHFLNEQVSQALFLNGSTDQEASNNSSDPKITYKPSRRPSKLS